MSLSLDIAFENAANMPIPLDDDNSDVAEITEPPVRISYKYLSDFLSIPNPLFDYSSYDFSSSRDEKIIENILSQMPTYCGDMIQRHVAAVFSRDAKSKHVFFGFNHLLQRRSNVKQSSVHAEESAIQSLLRYLGLSKNLKKMRYAEWCFLPPTRSRKNYPKKDEYHYHPV